MRGSIRIPHIILYRTLINRMLIHTAPVVENSVSEVKDILTSRGTKFKFADSKSKIISYSEEDIITSVKKLAKLGSGFRTVEIGRSVMIVSVPDELDNDHMQVMNIAEDDRFGPYGMVSVEHLRNALNWDEDRAKRALDLLLGKCMAWVDDFKGVKTYWFPRYVEIICFINCIESFVSYLYVPNT